MDVPLDQCPRILNSLRIKVFHSAASMYFAPSDLSGIGGMHCKCIRATPTWKKGPGCYDCVFIDKDPEAAGFCGLHAAQVQLLFSFKFDGKQYPCALVHWFTTYGNAPCEDIGLLCVQPDKDGGGQHVTSVVHIDTILHSAHLIGMVGNHFLPRKLSHADSLNAFHLFYVSKYADHHAHKIAF
jgi:hypothetical protein